MTAQLEFANNVNIKLAYLSEMYSFSHITQSHYILHFCVCYICKCFYFNCVCFFKAVILCNTFTKCPKIIQS